MAGDSEKNLEQQVRQAAHSSDHNFSAVYDQLSSNPGSNYRVDDKALATMNKAIHENGFPSVEIVGIDRSNHILTVADGEVQKRDAANFDSVSKIADLSSLKPDQQAEVNRIKALDTADSRQNEVKRSDGVMQNPRGDLFTNNQYGTINEFQYKGDAHSYKITSDDLYNLTGATELQTPDGRTFKSNGDTWDASDSKGNSLGKFKLGNITVNENGIEASGPDAQILNLPQGLRPVAAANPK